MDDIDLHMENRLATKVLDVCFGIHRIHGPGLFESVYEEICNYEFEDVGLSFVRQKSIPVIHKGVVINTGFRADFLIDNQVIVELKSIKALEDVHYKQVQTYLKLAKVRLGLLINFNVSYLKDGIKRVINTY